MNTQNAEQMYCSPEKAGSVRVDFARKTNSRITYDPITSAKYNNKMPEVNKKSPSLSTQNRNIWIFPRDVR